MDFMKLQVQEGPDIWKKGLHFGKHGDHIVKTKKNP